MRAAQIKQKLEGLGDAARAESSRRFFRDVGDDIFFGVSAPQIKALIRDEMKALGQEPLPFAEFEALLEERAYECRSLALCLLLEAFKKRPAERAAIAEFYLNHTARVNNWALVDVSAPILGLWLEDKDRAPLYALAQSNTMWEQRIAVVSTLVFIRRGDFKDTLHLCEQLMEHPHYLMHKAMGWMLREVGKKNPEALRTFLQAHAPRMPSVMLSYSLERFTPEERARWRAAGQHNARPAKTKPLA